MKAFHFFKRCQFLSGKHIHTYKIKAQKAAKASILASMYSLKVLSTLFFSTNLSREQLYNLILYFYFRYIQYAFFPTHLLIQQICTKRQAISKKGGQFKHITTASFFPKKIIGKNSSSNLNNYHFPTVFFFHPTSPQFSLAFITGFFRLILSL